MTHNPKTDPESFIRPSDLEPLNLCPGKALMAARMTDWLQAQGLEPAEQEATATGTIAHEVMRRAVESWRLLGEWPTIRAEPIDVGSGYEVTLDDWTVRCCNAALRFVADLIRSHEIEPDCVLTEQHLSGADFGLPRGGTADLCLVVPHRLLIIVDYKFGFLEQSEAENHDQLAAYGLMGQAHFGTVRQVMAYLYQARMDRAQRVSGATFSAETLRGTAEWVRSVCAAARSAEPPLVAGYTQCHNCRALVGCGAARKLIMHARDLSALLAPETSAEHGELCSALKLAEKWADEGIKLEKQRLTAGQPVDGWALVPSGAMTVIDALHAVKCAEQAGQLPELLKFASFKAAAADELECISPAVSMKDKAPSLKPSKKG